MPASELDGYDEETFTLYHELYGLNLLKKTKEESINYLLETRGLSQPEAGLVKWEMYAQFCGEEFERQVELEKSLDSAYGLKTLEI